MTAAEVQEHDLIESLTGEWLKLPLNVMRDCGPAVQTLAGLLKVTNKETFVPVETIAHRARVPVKTARNHLDLLDSKKWIKNHGRGLTRRGAPRRTCTLQILPATTQACDQYGVLPWWACCRGGNVHLTWSTKAVLSLVMAKLMSLKAAIDEANGQADMDSDDYWGSIANMGDEDRFRFRLQTSSRGPGVCDVTGLDHKSVFAANRVLHDRGIVEWSGYRKKNPRRYRADGGFDTHVLMPRQDFRVVARPASEGQVFVDFMATGKLGSTYGKTG